VPPVTATIIIFLIYADSLIRNVTSVVFIGEGRFAALKKLNCLKIVSGVKGLDFMCQDFFKIVIWINIHDVPNKFTPIS